MTPPLHNRHESGEFCTIQRTRGLFNTFQLMKPLFNYIIFIRHLRIIFCLGLGGSSVINHHWTAQNRRLGFRTIKFIALTTPILWFSPLDRKHLRTISEVTLQYAKRRRRRNTHGISICPFPIEIPRQFGKSTFQEIPIHRPLKMHLTVCFPLDTPSH